VIASSAEIGARTRTDLAVVVDQLEHMPHEEAVVLLARLRDIHSQRVLLLLDDGGWDREELRALGYLQFRRRAAGKSVYLFDPDLFHEPREWNNPANWANPDNFGKFRW
jgi:Family of unknown function (DUF6231)